MEQLTAQQWSVKRRYFPSEPVRFAGNAWLASTRNLLSISFMPSSSLDLLEHGLIHLAGL